ncbi:RNA polymerase factor sigma-54 [Limibacter armeniacum]|uniref:RNA polymerase factor sigma-54 n=1 Tax=Limibacter armeniacum TaxID=466084 RepID=UPI002FE6361A
MQKLNLTQGLQQKLSPQQIQFIKLLQIPTVELASRIEEELEINPALEEGRDDELERPTNEEESMDSEYDDMPESHEEDISLDDYVNDDEVFGYKMQGDGPSVEEEREMPIPMVQSLTDQLVDQLGFLQLDDRQHIIGMQLIGSIDNDGYIRRDLEAIVNDLAFSLNIETDVDELDELLKRIQHSFDPPGIAARDLQECLELQLLRKDNNDPEIVNARKVVVLCFEEFKKKHYKKIQKKLGLNDDDLREAINHIIKLNPKPGGFTSTYARVQYLTPDFIIREINGALQVTLNAKNAPELRVSRSYAEMIDTYEKSKKKDKSIKQTVRFVKQKLDAAKWFIDAIKQRQETLLKTMNAIVEHQYDFFITGDEGKLKPMILKDIAQRIGMDISTVSRVANSKAVQTDFGIYPLKYFFSESITTESGEDVSSKEVKHVLKTIIDGEDKAKPLSDDKLEKLLKIKGYNIARRTVAKYREQLNIPVARLRKEL